MNGENTYIRGITDELTEKDLLAVVKGVDDQTQKLVALMDQDPSPPSEL